MPPNYTLLKGAGQAIKSQKLWMKPCELQVSHPQNLPVEEAPNSSST